MTYNLTLYSVKAFIILDATTGARILVKYFPPPPSALTHSASAPIKDTALFEKKLFDKTKKLNNEILLFENHLVIYKSCLDTIFYLVGSLDENELMLSAALHCFIEALTLAFVKHPVEKRTILDYFDLVSLCLDEWIDQGVIMETDSQTLVSRVSKRPSDLSELSLSDPQSISDALNKAKDQLLSGVLMK